MHIIGSIPAIMTSITIQLLVRTTTIKTLVPIVYIPTVIHRIVMIIIVE